ncbi:MAG: amidohydrolase [Cyclobacteriaceae bacterium]|nr:amidohydrolase [Cyclobacteriaceae bacterium]
MKFVKVFFFGLVGFLFLSTSKVSFVEQYLERDMDFLLEFYKERHQNPEISLQEKNTSAALANELEKLGFEVTRDFGGHGVVGILKNGNGPTVLYRTDMDALPMYEKTGLGYASEKTIDFRGSTSGTMHSCGHDIHMTTWLGVAKAMSQNKKGWKGTLMLIGQPAEEIGAGARLMLNAGLYEKFGVPDHGIGLHCSPTLKAGKVAVSDGYSMANAEMIEIEVYGQGAHGASPHMSVDPVVIASMIVMDLQTIASRNVKPVDDVVVTVGAIQGGTVGNIIPDQVSMKLTVRTFKEEVRQLVHKRIKEICNGVAMGAGLPEDKWPTVTIPEKFTLANYNDPVLVSRVKNTISGKIGTENVEEAEPQMVGEDFSLYGHTKEDVPTVLFWLGTVTQEKIDKNDLPGLHSPFYYPDPEKTIETGVMVTSATLLDLFNKKK